LLPDRVNEVIPSAMSKGSDELKLSSSASAEVSKSPMVNGIGDDGRPGSKTTSAISEIVGRALVMAKDCSAAKGEPANAVSIACTLQKYSPRGRSSSAAQVWVPPLPRRVTSRYPLLSASGETMSVPPGAVPTRRL
jgi:hypothetical protein